LLYDYFGFPPESYRIHYPAPGAPDLAKRIHTLLADSGLQPRVDERRGFDHGLFVPLKIMYPQAVIPCLQVSLLASLDPKAHIALGKALAPLRRENVLIIGSGFSFHNLRAFFTSPPNTPDQESEVFNQWLIDTCTAGTLSPKEREQRLANWEQAPHARYCHPREEHLLPLHVCYGMTQAPARLVFNETVIGKRACAFLW
jgi:4,5-DOPA dioxygenase extradiol